MANAGSDSPKRKRSLATFVKFVRAYDSLRRRLEPELTRHGVTPSQFGVLEAVYHLGPLNQRDIGLKTLSSKANLTTVINNLERDGLVKKHSVPSDRRQNMIRLTDKGRRLVGRIFPQQALAIEREFGVLTAAEQETLGGLCLKLGRR